MRRDCRDKDGARRTPSWFARLMNGVGTVAGLLVFVTAISISADVTLRYAMSAPIRGMYELAELTMAVAMGLAMVYATFVRAHISMEVLGSLSGYTLGVRCVAAVLTMAIFAFVAFNVLEFAIGKVRYGETSFLLGLPVAPVWFAVAALFALAVIAQGVVLGEIVASLSRLSGTFVRAELTWPIAMLVPTLAAAVVLFALSASASPFPLSLAGFALLACLCIAHVPLGIALAASALLGTLALTGPLAMGVIASNNVVSALSSVDLAAVPLFLLMGNLAIAAGFADDIFDASRQVTGRMRGGLALTAILGSGGFGTISGSSIATAATIGRVAGNEMLDRGYSPRLATGSIAAGGTLGALVPPSIVLIVYSLTAEVSIQKTFIAAIVPAGLAVLLYCATVWLTVRIKPSLAPDPEPNARIDWLRVAALTWRAALLFLTIIGGLYGGVFTVQEAAAVGTGITIVFWLTSGKASVNGLIGALRDTAATAAALYLLLIGANIFGAFLNSADLMSALLTVVDPATMPVWMVLAILIVTYLILGSVFDAMAAMVVTLPFVIPLLVQMDLNLIWWGVVMLTLIEVGMITPPIGMNVFVLKSVLQGRVTLSTIFAGVWPFLIADSIRLALLLAFPALALWLPTHL